MSKITTSNLQSSCLNCTNRTIGCHSKCEMYLKYRNEISKSKAIIKNNKDKEYDYIDYCVKLYKKF